jgi:hypothetical protein
VVHAGVFRAPDAIFDSSVGTVPRVQAGQLPDPVPLGRIDVQRRTARAGNG